MGELRDAAASAARAYEAQRQQLAEAAAAACRWQAAADDANREAAGCQHALALLERTHAEVRQAAEVRGLPLPLQRERERGRERERSWVGSREGGAAAAGGGGERAPARAAAAGRA